MDANQPIGVSFVEIVDGWEYAGGTADGECPARDAWISCATERTVAGVLALSVAGEGYPTGLDDREHWFANDVNLEVDDSGELPPTLLRLGGVATVAEFYWNGHLVGSSTSMFSEHTIDVSGLSLPGSNRLAVRCLSLSTWLQGRKPPRARWKTRVVEDQKLRCVRTTLLGRATGWSPPTTVVGVTGPAQVAVVAGPVITAHSLRAALTGNDGTVAGSVELTVPAGSGPDGVDVVLSLAGGETVVAGCVVERVGGGAATDRTERWRATVDLRVSDPARWWPHTHGPAVLHDLSLNVRAADGVVWDLPVDRVGFREIVLDREVDGNGFALSVNGTPVFVRGGAWFPLDPTTFREDADVLRGRLEVIRGGGHNMVRISGTVAYGSPTFYRTCSELGLMVWQDLPFANFDYPTDDAFLDTVRGEVTSFLRRCGLPPALCVIAGNSEVRQQAVMMGLPLADAGADALVDMCAEVIRAAAPELLFVESSPTGGHVPFAVNSGVSHYFGVGAYRRPLTDARHSGVRFTAECLALSNVPVPQTVRSVIADGTPTPANPSWKQRVPRDRGTGWDFEDIRDFYARELFGVDPDNVRYADPERYLAIGRAVSSTVMERTLSEWRRPDSPCRGALLWTLNDLWPGAGWGLVDSNGHPKAAFWGAKRALSPIGVVGVDEGLNGLDLHLFNDSSAAVSGCLRVQAVRGSTLLYSAEIDVTVGPHGAERHNVDTLFGRFTDPTYAYRFGPRSVDAISATWFGPDGELLGRYAYIPPGVSLTEDAALELRGEAYRISDTEFALRLSAGRPARFVTVDPGATSVIASDDHMTLVPHEPPYTVKFRVVSGPLPKRVFVSALNGSTETVITISPSVAPA